MNKLRLSSSALLRNRSDSLRLWLLRSLRSPSIIHHLLCFAIAVIHNNSGGMFHPPPFFVLLHCFVHGTSDNVILLFFCQLDEVNCIT